MHTADVTRKSPMGFKYPLADRLIKKGKYARDKS